MWVCLLFALVISTNCWGESVTVTFGQGNTSGSGSTLPNEGTRTISGVTATTNLKLKSTVKYQSTETTYNYSFSNDNTDYVDISVAEGYYITGVGTSVLYDGDGDGSLYIQFYSTSDKNNAVGTPIALNGDSYNNFYTYPPSTSSVSLPEGTKKSARIYKSGTRAWGILFYRLVVNIECVSKTASFTGTGSTSGSAPSNINACVGTNILIPNAGTLVKTGYDFVGWNDGTTTYSVNEEYQLDDNTSFSPVWTEHVIPAVTNLNAAVDDDDVTISWTNYNKLDLTSDNVKEEGWNDGGEINSLSVSNGVLSVSYTTSKAWAWKSIEIPLSREMNHVTSIDMQYTYNNAQAKDGNNEGGIAPYMMYNEDGGWTCFWKRSDPTSLGFWASNVTEYTNYNLTPDQILGSTGSGSYDNQRLIHKVGLLIDPAVASSGTFTVKDICINTTDNQTTLDEIKIIRKKGSAPSSISDGTQVYSGVLNTFTDENVEDGLYYYAVYAREGEAYSAAVVEGPIQIGTPKADPELTASVDKGAISTTGSAQLTVSTANAYDGTIEYSVSPSGVISLNETTGEITAVAAGTATITVTAPATATHYADNKSVTVTVLAAPTTNLAIGGVDGDNVTLTWDVPGKIDLRTAKTTSNYLSSSSCDSYSYITYASNYNINNDEELDVTYSVNDDGVVGVLFDVDLTSVESISFEYKGDYTGDGWDGIFPAFYNPTDKRLYWEGGSHNLAETSWTSKTISPSSSLWCSGSSASGNMKELGFFANFDKYEASLSNAHMYIRNVFYHCTGMTDIDHIVIMRTTGAAATDTVSGTKIYSGKMSHFVDTESKAAGLYYYTLFAVYANGCIPVESVSAAYENPYKTHTRTGLTAGDYGTICLPYAVAAEDIAGADIYEFNGWQTGSNVVELDLVDAMEAGHPYIYQATASEATWRYLEQNYTAAGSHKGLIGSYTKEEITPNDGNYIIYANQLYLVDCTQIYVGVNKAYINRPDAENAYEATSLAPGKKRVYMGVYGEQVVTDIDQITNDQSPLNNKIIKDNQLFILRDGKIYNAQGQLVK